MKITSQDAATGPVLEIAGDLDYETAPAFRQAVDGLALTGGQLLVVDLGGLEFCDSSGISALLAARNLTTEQGTSLALAAIPANTARILRIVGLDRVFTIHPDTSTAITQAVRQTDRHGRAPG